MRPFTFPFAASTGDLDSPQERPTGPAARPILFLCAGAGLGGMERVVLSLSRELSQRGARLRVVLPDVPGADETAAWFADSGAPQPEISAQLAHAFGRRRLGGVFRLAVLVRRSGALVVNLHHGMNFPSLNDVLAVRLGGARCVASVHGGGGADPPACRGLARKNHLAGALCSAVVAVSAFQAERLIRDGIPARKIRVVPNGTDAPPKGVLPLRSAARERLGVPPEAFVIATASRLTDRKGTADLIAALAAVIETDRAVFGTNARSGAAAADLFLAIAGTGPEQERLQDLARRAAPDRHRFLGRLGPDGMEDLYAAADLFALPSLEESFGLVFAEAALRGMPSIGTHVGGVPDTVRHSQTGLLVPPGDVAALARAIRTLRNDASERERMGRAARRLAEAQFTASRMADRYERIFNAAQSRVTSPPSTRKTHATAHVLRGDNATRREHPTP